METLLGVLDLLHCGGNGCLCTEGCKVDDARVSLHDCAIFNGCLAYEDLVLGRQVLSLLPGGRVNLLVYVLHISDLKDLSVPLVHGGLE